MINPTTQSGDATEKGLTPLFSYFVLGSLMLAGLFWISLQNFLLFHSLAELFCVAVAGSVFLLVWNARPFIKNDAVLFLGIAYLFIGFIDLMHTLAYKGMGIFPDIHSSNQATQLWIAGRALEALSLLAFPFVLTRRVYPRIQIGIYAAVTALLMASIFAGTIFPTCYVDGAGLTAFKKGAEYVISLVLLCGIVFLVRKRGYLDETLFGLMIATLAFTIAAELAFTFYSSVYGLSNVVGHFLKVISYFLVYMALIRSCLTRPYMTLFWELQQEKSALSSKMEALHQAFDQIKTLRGIVPICMHCKKIRDDKGYWNQVEVYVSDHTEADFSHGLCPECAKTMYPTFENNEDGGVEQSTGGAQ